MFFCNRCSEPFRPKSNRQRYCGADCRNAAKADYRRQFRHAVRQVKRSLPDLPEPSERTERVFPAVTDLGAESTTEDGRLALVPDKHDDQEAILVTYLQAAEAQFAYQLDAAKTRAADRARAGLPEHFPCRHGLGQTYKMIYKLDEAKGMLVLIDVSDVG